MTILGKGVGVLAKGIGSGSPSFVMEERPDPEIIHPFKCRFYFEGGVPKVLVRAGTVNNIVPTINDEPLDSDVKGIIELTNPGNLMHVVLEASVGDPPVFLPDTITVQLKAPNAHADTDENGYLVIGSYVLAADGKSFVTTSQFVYASQVLVRAKPGTATALWFWSSR
jgi:hypothetical protein